MTDYLTDFVQESEERITELNNALLTLEREPTNDEAMESIFRVAHTLKSNCGAMGLDAASDLAHAIEDLLDAVRTDDLEVTPELMDVIFDAVDELETLIDEVAADGETETDPSATIEALREYLEHQTDSTSVMAPSPEAIDAVLERFDPPADDDHEIYFTRLELTERNDVNNGVLVVDALVDAFDLLATEPPRSDIEAGDDEGRIDAAFASAVGEAAIISGLEPVEAVADFELRTVTDRFEALADTEPSDATSPTEPPAAGPGDGISSDEAKDLEVDELLDEFNEFDNLDEMVEDIEDDDLEMFDDMGDAGSFDDLIDDDELAPAEASTEPAADHEPATEPSTADSESTADASSDDVDDAGAVFNELKDEVEMVGFDELQDELDELEFDEFDSDDEVGMDELIGEDVDVHDDSFLDETEPTDDDIDEMLVESDAADLEAETDLESDETSEPGDETATPASGILPEAETDATVEADTEPNIDTESPTATDASLEDESDSTDSLEDAATAEPVAADSTDDSTDDETAEDPFAGDAAVETYTELTASDDEFDADASGLSEFDDDTFDDDFADAFGDDSFGDDDFDDTFGDDFDLDDSADSASSASSSSSTASFGDDAVETEPEEDDVVRRIDEPTFETPEIEIPETTDRPAADQQTDDVQSVRVDVEQIDSLLTLVEGLVTTRVRLRDAVSEGEDTAALETELDDLSDVTTELQETVMDIRLVPLETVVNRLPRVVRDIAREQDKEIDFEMSGEDVELDRSILDRIGDPLIHLVRNAVDHGIESPEDRERAGKPRTGAVDVHADRSRDSVTITVEDDGSGLDPDRLRSEAVTADVLTEAEATALSDEEAYDLIFHPGLSTTDEVTDVSGRGVGMDVVKRTVEDLEGTVAVESEPGSGTRVTMTLPVTVAIDDVLFLESGGEEFGIPTKAVLDIEPADGLEEIDGRLALSESDGEYSVVPLDDALETPKPRANGDGMLVRIRDDVRPVVLHCDYVRGQQEVVVKPFEGFMGDIPGLSGATVRGRGEVVNILDVNTL
ncbi:chemotaxis protein CheA [Natronorubrum thiooxidans]|uniref:Chemotaxis protein CheA n=1 Tax=Natronorubrum thiooxidans TaxID=308853 RepID=A0A1N7DDC9_9EURY|nr:chemotaxis protein CheA [Natronorubrum thiooxidans]SIR73784.1 two-component system, chemotaxis family, sensor kinase CheA [Natronorubrum thiooxidans]